jgi:hypothetical protein
MTWALCLNCGEVKFGAICPCPKCQVSSTGDMQLDIAFSDHHLGRQSLEQLGAVVAAIHRVSSDEQLCFWTVIRYISLHHPTILGVNLDPDIQGKCDALLAQVALPSVSLHPSPREEWAAQLERKKNKRWWEFWKKADPEDN